MPDRATLSDLNDYFHQQITLQLNTKSALEQEIAQRITQKTGNSRVAHHNTERASRRDERLLFVFSPPMLLMWALLLALIIWLI